MSTGTGVRTSLAVSIVALAATACSLNELPQRSKPLDRRAATRPATTAPSRFDCPAWAQETVPERVRPYLGRFGLPEPYPQQKTPLGGDTAGVDLWQANHFVGYHKETAEYLYKTYSPTAIAYRKGSLPGYERLVAQYTAGCKSDREKALALLKRAMPKAILHPSIPPYGPMCPPDRAAGDEELLKSGQGWCNEQARVFVRLCQVAGIPARMIFLTRCWPAKPIGSVSRKSLPGPTNN
jgi:transglutaminase-like putative cysteine protease